MKSPRERLADFLERRREDRAAMTREVVREKPSNQGPKIAKTANRRLTD